MVNFIFFDNLIEFLNDLYELLKEDWKKFKLFINENKKNLIWLFIALITLQITDLISFGNSCNKYYKKQNEQIQKGGAASAPAAAAPQLSPTELKAQKKAVSDSKVEAHKKKLLEKKADKKAKKATESQNVQKNLDLVNELKGKTDKISKNGIAGPLFGNLGGVFDSLGAIFSIFAILLTIVGVFSLPVLIFIIITYCIIKKVLGHLALI